MPLPAGQDIVSTSTQIPQQLQQISYRSQLINFNSVLVLHSVTVSILDHHQLLLQVPLSNFFDSSPSTNRQSQAIFSLFQYGNYTIFSILYPATPLNQDQMAWLEVHKPVMPSVSRALKMFICFFKVMLSCSPIPPSPQKDMVTSCSCIFSRHISLTMKLPYPIYPPLCISISRVF